MRRIFLAVCPTLVSVSFAGAQIIRAPGGEPPVLVYASLGFLQAETIFDGSSGSAWDFGSALQFRVSLEKRISEGASLGIAVSRAAVPLRYALISTSAPSATSCTNQGLAYCDASTDLTTVTASFTAGGSYGFHQILNIGAGISLFDDFREDGTGKLLAPTGGDKDFYLAFGYGVGYGLSNHFAISIVQDAGVVLHQRTGLSGNRDSYHQILTTRLGFRLALGR